MDPVYVFDDQFLAVREDRRGNVATGEPLPHEVAAAVELDLSPGIDAADEGDPSASQREMQPTLSVAIRIQGEMGRSKPQQAAVVLEPGARVAGAVLGHTQGPVRLAAVVVAQEAGTGSPQRAKVRAQVPQHTLLPERVEALDMRVPAWLTGREENEMNAQQQVEPHDEGEGVRVPASTGSSHLVVDLGDSGDAQVPPGLDEVPAEEVGRLVAALAGGHTTATVWSE